MFQSSELRNSVYSFQKSVDNKEVHESLHDQDRNRHDTAIGDLACRKINRLPYGVSIKKPLLLSTTQVGLPIVGIDVSVYVDIYIYNSTCYGNTILILNVLYRRILCCTQTIIDSSTTDARRDRAIRELKHGSIQDLHKKMMSRAYDYAKEAKTAKDPCGSYQTAAILFDNIMM
jgi:hypothetical protein